MGVEERLLLVEQLVSDLASKLTVLENYEEDHFELWKGQVMDKVEELIAGHKHTQVGAWTANVQRRMLCRTLRYDLEVFSGLLTDLRMRLDGVAAELEGTDTLDN